VLQIGCEFGHDRVHRTGGPHQANKARVSVASFRRSSRVSATPSGFIALHVPHHG
jgi:hypothetical protein